MIPLFVDCSGRRIVIFGGGAVAARKAAYFTGEAQVLIVSRSFSPELTGSATLQKQLDVTGEPDESLLELITGSFLVIGALSDRDQNNRIGSLCRRRGILFNNADGEPGDVIIPSVTRRDHYMLAISTGGSSPAISRFIREHLDRELPALDAMIVLQERLRKKLRTLELDQARRTAILHQVIDDALVWQLLESEPGEAWNHVMARYFHG